MRIGTIDKDHQISGGRAQDLANRDTAAIMRLARDIDGLLERADALTLRMIAIKLDEAALLCRQEGYGIGNR